MSTTCSDIQKFDYCKLKAKNNDIVIIVAGDGFELKHRKNYNFLGKIGTLEELFSYLCGYEAGLDRGLVDGINS